MKHIRIFTLAVALSLCFAVFTCFVSNNLWSRFQHRQDVIDEQFAILKGESFLLGGAVCYWPTFQNRVLFAYGLKFLSGFGMLSISKWYLLLRLFTAFLAFFVFFYAVVKAGGVKHKAAAMGMMLLAYGFVLSFNYRFEYPPDFLDAVFMILFLWAALKARPMMLLIFALLGSMNRESCVFAGVIWIFVNGFNESFKPKYPEILYGALVSAASYSSAIVIRLALGGSKITYLELNVGLPYLAAKFKEFLHNPTNSSWPVLLAAMFAPLVLWLWYNRKTLTSLHLRLLAASAAIILMSQQYSGLDDLRMFIPAFTIAVYVAVVSDKDL